MIRLSAIALAAGLAVTGASLAHADEPALTGAWTYQVGATGTPCKVTLAEGGDVSAADNCPGGLTRLGHWKAVGRSLQLMSPAGNLVAILHAKDGGFSGKQIGGGRSIALSR